MPSLQCSVSRWYALWLTAGLHLNLTGHKIECVPIYPFLHMSGSDFIFNNTSSNVFAERKRGKLETTCTPRVTTLGQSAVIKSEFHEKKSIVVFSVLIQRCGEMSNKIVPEFS